jgi:hypothetical protein
MHWLLDVEFKDDLSRYRARHGAKNMAVVRRFALNLVRAIRPKEASKPIANARVGAPNSCWKSFSSDELWMKCVE